MHRPRQRKLPASPPNRIPRRHRNPVRQLLTSDSIDKGLLRRAICPAEIVRKLIDFVGNRLTGVVPLRTPRTIFRTGSNTDRKTSSGESRWCRGVVWRKETPSAPGGRNARLGLRPAMSVHRRIQCSAAIVQVAPRLTRSGAASVDQTPHSPQLKVRRSVRPPLRGMVRVRCIDRPQFGHSGRTMLWSPTGRFSSCNANMGPLAVHFKRTNEIQTHV